MIRFVGGPADGQALRLANTPRLLRVVQNAGGELAALDEPNDRAKPDESIFVYVRESEPFSGIIDHVEKGKGRSGEPFVNATYTYLGTQPEDNQMRGNAIWRTWSAKFSQALEEHQQANA